ncbi:hypothetical protein [Mesorhizobium sp. NZP2077]|uniref:hypothetical protein n=1 Tax=Mesorhizobium sp. NZP2077 TaxID=2483404 RepID=UPI001FEE5FDD|nr:hypothetical protein [Mesorhizobium sp. NZP2077]
MNSCASYERVFSPFTAANATFALNAGECVRRLLFVISTPDSRRESSLFRRVWLVLEACGGSHYWAREIAALGHDVRLIPPIYVKPFVKMGKRKAPTPKRSPKPSPARPCVRSDQIG